MHEQKDKGNAVAVSCGAGCGRTGTILACYLISSGYSADAALELLLSRRPCSSEILRSAKQKHAIYEFQARLKSSEATA